MELPKDDADERYDELAALEATYPELVLGTTNNNPSGTLDIAVNLIKPISLVCQDRSDGGEVTEAYYSVSHLPPLTFSFELPQGYPVNKPPVFAVKSTWLATQTQNALIPHLLKLWEDTRDQVLYAAIDSLYQQAETGFGIDNNGALVLDLSNNPTLKDQLLEYDTLSTKKDFDLQTFKCAICQYPKKGIVCTQLSNCRHVFCTECMKAFLDAVITQGYIEQVKCPNTTCGQDIAKGDLIALVGEELSKRYEMLKRKKALEKDPLIMVCPRSTCQALIKPPPTDQNLVICDSCSYAYCRNCQKSWHGKFTECLYKPVVPEETLMEYIDSTKEERREFEMIYGKVRLQKEETDYKVEKEFQQYASSNYIKCPECNVFVERGQGCNKITCRCGTWFCYLCGINLKKLSNPYDHFSSPESTCYAKLYVNTEIEHIN